MSRLLLLCLWLALVSIASTARDSQGTEFILGYMENTQWKNNALNDIELFITTISNTPASVTVTTPKFNPSWSATITVSRGNIETVKVPHTIRGVGVEKSNKGVWVQATQEVSVYSVNKEPKSTDAYISLPVDVLGTEYYAVTYTKDAELLVVATQDSTQVSIRWPDQCSSCAVAYGGTTYRKGDTLTLTLNKFETFHARQLHDDSDFTGAYITSNKPISVVSGNKKIPVPVKSGTADHLTEMLMPVDTWGKTFLTTSTPDRSIGDIFRVVASEADTTVSLSGGGSYSISQAGYFKDIDISTGDYQTMTTNKPVLVAMFTKTFKNDGPNYGDPAMSIIIPTPQYASDYTWSSVKDPTGAEFNNKVSIIIKQSEMSGLRLDGSAVTWKEQKAISGSDMIHLWARVTPGSHNIYHTDPSVTFLALVSGTYKVNSYAYAAGLRLAQINTVCVPSTVVAGDVLDNDCDGNIDEEVLNNLDDDGDGLVDEDLALPPRVDGQWGTWGSYGACSVSCGGTGTKIRTRACDNPAPANNGLDCVGTGSESASCNNGVCAVNDNGECVVNGAWGNWGSWASCSVTCGSGTKSRSRNCNNPAPSNGGSQCPGTASDSATCSLSACSVDGAWGSWGAWGSCSLACGSGSKSRTRACDSPAPQHGGNQCPGSSSSSTSCNTHACSVHGAWGSWGAWGSCSLTCASGSKSRTRACDSPAPQHGGNQCPGSSSSSTSCNTQSCPVDGAWGSWGAWGTCSLTCASGSHSRTRSCDSPAPQHGGSQCPGSSSSSTSCNTHSCPVDGAWGSWGAWGTCSLTCGSGSKSRTRACDSPAPQHGGSQCPGSSSSSTSCNTHSCPVDGAWAPWSSWGTCSTTCELGTWSRSRSCTDPAPAHGGANCQGSTSDSSGCNLRPCPVDGGWSAWQAWSACSVTCMGIGVRGRIRDCDNPVPLHGGSNCSGSFGETETCDNALVLCSPGNGWAVNVYSTTPGSPVNGGFGPWGQWSACSKSCGAGMRLRKRECNSPVPKFGGTVCSGNYVKKEICGNVPCSGSESYVQTCPERYFDCKDGNTTCVHFLKKCDCVSDCDDASDEDPEYAGCISDATICHNSAYTLVPVDVLTMLLVVVAASLPTAVTCTGIQ